MLNSNGLAWCKMVGVVELESTTSTMSTWRSNQLSYTPSSQIENSIYYTIDLRKVKHVLWKKRKKAAGGGMFPFFALNLPRPRLFCHLSAGAGMDPPNPAYKSDKHGIETNNAVFSAPLFKQPWKMVRDAGVEPANLSVLGPKPSAFANFASRARTSKL